MAVSLASDRMLRFPRSRAREIVTLLKDTVNHWSNDKAQRLGASLAFYTLLSLAPLLIVVIAVAAVFFGKDAVEGQLAWQIQNIIGSTAAQAVQGLLRGADKPVSGTIATVLSLLTLLFGGSAVVIELHDALNTIWHVQPGTATFWGSITAYLKERFFSFALIIGSGLLLLASLVWSAWIALMGKYFGSLLPIPELAFHVAASLISFLAITLVFAAIYKIVPNVQLRWSDVIVGASVTSLVFTAGKQLLALYLGKESFESTYGAAGSLVMLLVWVYYSAQLFFLGAEFTKVYATTMGSYFVDRLKPTPSRPEAGIVTERPRIRT